MSGMSFDMPPELRCAPGTGTAGPQMPLEGYFRPACGSGGEGGKTREDEHGPGVAAQEAEPEVRRPPLYKVVIVNDDYTPMEFVVEVLQTIFRIDRNKAVQIMLYVHTRGRGVAGVFTYEIAETKAAQVNEYARQHQHPLLCTLEEA